MPTLRRLNQICHNPTMQHNISIIVEIEMRQLDKVLLNQKFYEIDLSEV
jgi:hypothetical protein